MPATGSAAARRLVFLIAAWQLALGIAIALPLWAAVSLRTGYSALLGGAIAAAATASMALGLRLLGAPATANRLLGGLMVAELLKFVLTGALFVAVILALDVAPAAMLGTYLAAFIVYWIVLIKATSKLMP
jgi:F0F1-type ATP synthase assembly protein I